MPETKASPQKAAVYAGTFDPVTIGHLWMVEQGAALFDHLIVAIGVNPDKRCMFSLEERLDMLREATARFPNIEITSYSHQFLIAYAQTTGARYILRGIRTGSDYEFERAMRNVNGDLNPHISTVFLIPPRGIAEVSSSMVKGLVGPDGWEKVLKNYVPDAVLKRLMRAVNEPPK